MENQGYNSERLQVVPAREAARRAAFQAESDDFIRRTWQGTRITHANINESAAEMAQRLGVTAPTLYRAASFDALSGGPLPNMMVYNSTELGEPSVMVMTDSFLKEFGYSPHGEVPIEMRATVGHELGHVKQGAKYLTAIREYPVLLGPVIGLAAVYLYDRALKAEQGGKPSAATLDAQAEQLRQQLNATGMPVAVRRTHDAVVDGARYGAAALAGLGGGLMVTRQLVRQIEFDADRTGALLVGDAGAMVRALEIIRNSQRNMSEELRQRLSAQTSGIDLFDAMIYHAHPGHGERVANLKTVAQEIAQGAGKHALRAIESGASHLHI